MGPLKSLLNAVKNLLGFVIGTIITLTSWWLLYMMYKAFVVQYAD